MSAPDPERPWALYVTRGTEPRRIEGRFACTWEAWGRFGDLAWRERRGKSSQALEGEVVHEEERAP